MDQKTNGKSFLRGISFSAIIFGMGFVSSQTILGAPEGGDLKSSYSATQPIETAGVRTAALDSTLWEQSEWISAKEMPVVTGRVNDGTRAADGASWFSTTIRNDKKIASARWMVSGLGVFDVFVNGKLIGEEVLKPGFTHYAKTRQSFTYDITDALSKKKEDDNILSVQVTPGWWADKIITPGGNEGMIGSKPAFRGILELTYTDGTKSYHGTNTRDWQGAVGGPVTHAAIFDGEEYDARTSWPLGPSDIKGETEPNVEFSGGIFPSSGAEVYRRNDLTLNPIEAYVWKGVSGEKENEYGKVNIIKRFSANEPLTVSPGETLVVDFGQNCAGVPEFEFMAEEGTTLTFLPSEILNDGNGAKSRGMDGPEGSTHRLNLRIPEEGMILKYTFGNGKGDDSKGGDGKVYVSYSPRNTFFGYRYASITADKDVKIKSLKTTPVTSIAQNLERGRLSTGNPLVNQLISNTIWGMRSNYLSVPTDCPQRNERLGWTADTQVFAETGTYFADTRDFFHKWMRDMRDTQTERGAFPGVAPIAQYGAMPTDMMRLGWADAGVIVPWTVWKQYGDKNIVAENWDAMEKYMDYLDATNYDHNSLLSDNGNYQWADWLSYEPLESCSGRKDYQDADGNWKTRSEAVEYWNYLSACYWLMDAEMMRDMAKDTGRDHAKYERMAKKARKYIQDNFMTPEGLFKTDILNTMQTPALFALRNVLVEGKAKEDMINRLRQNFADHGNCLQTGFLGTSLLMPTLTDNGMADIAYELLFQRKNPSWMYSIDNGATTIWERWNSYMKDSGMGPQGMNSFNHYAYGCVCEWMWETMAGISADPSEPGFRKIIMKPIPDRRLGHVDAEYDSAAGKIKSSWRYEGDDWVWDFTIPEGAVAIVTLPAETKSKEYPSGKHTVRMRL